MYSTEERRALLQLARDSIDHGLEEGCVMEVAEDGLPEPLCQERACFVTLERHGQLRGCIGSLSAYRTLGQDVAENAYAAAFRDPRFPPLSRDELEGLELHISVLSPAEPMYFSSEADLIAQLRPRVDGLILEEGYHRGTFLPSVWEQLPEPHQFLAHLKLKAGLPADYWSDSLKVSRYTTEMFPE